MKHLLKAAGLLAALCLTGCGHDLYALPEDPVVFETATFVNPDDPEDTFQSVERDGRTYILFGLEKGMKTPETAFMESFPVKGSLES